MQNDIPDRLGSSPVDSGYLHAASDYYEIDSHALTNRHYLRTPWWNTSGKFDIRKKSLSGKQASRIFQIKTIEQFLGYSGLTKHNYKVASIVGLGPIVLPPIMQTWLEYFSLIFGGLFQALKFNTFKNK